MAPSPQQHRKTSLPKSYVISLTQRLYTASEAWVSVNTHTEDGADIIRRWLINYRSVGKKQHSLSLSLWLSVLCFFTTHLRKSNSNEYN